MQAAQSWCTTWNRPAGELNDQFVHNGAIAKDHSEEPTLHCDSWSPTLLPDYQLLSLPPDSQLLSLSTDSQHPSPSPNSLLHSWALTSSFQITPALDSEQPTIPSAVHAHFLSPCPPTFQSAPTIQSSLTPTTPSALSLRSVLNAPLNKTPNTMEVKVVTHLVKRMFHSNSQCAEGKSLNLPTGGQVYNTPVHSDNTHILKIMYCIEYWI